MSHAQQSYRNYKDTKVSSTSRVARASADPYPQLQPQEQNLQVKQERHQPDQMSPIQQRLLQKEQTNQQVRSEKKKSQQQPLQSYQNINSKYEQYASAVSATPSIPTTFLPMPPSFNVPPPPVPPQLPIIPVTTAQTPFNLPLPKQQMVSNTSNAATTNTTTTAITTTTNKVTASNTTGHMPIYNAANWFNGSPNSTVTSTSSLLANASTKNAPTDNQMYYLPINYQMTNSMQLPAMSATPTTGSAFGSALLPTPTVPAGAAYPPTSSAPLLSTPTTPYPQAAGVAYSSMPAAPTTAPLPSKPYASTPVPPPPKVPYPSKADLPLSSPAGIPLPSESAASLLPKSDTKKSSDKSKLNKKCSESVQNSAVDSTVSIKRKPRSSCKTSIKRTADGTAIKVLTIRHPEKVKHIVPPLRVIAARAIRKYKRKGKFPTNIPFLDVILRHNIKWSEALTARANNNAVGGVEGVRAGAGATAAVGGKNGPPDYVSIARAEQPLIANSKKKCCCLTLV